MFLFTFHMSCFGSYDSQTPPPTNQSQLEKKNNCVVLRNLKVKRTDTHRAEMKHFIYLLFLMGLFQKGLTALVQTQQTVMAAVGEEAHLNCQLMQKKDVVQVTWQKVSPEKEENVATFNRYFGPRVNPDFIDNVEFKDAGLQNNSIVIRNLTEQDEGCYRCLFSTYPEGALTAITCLQVYELHEPILHVRESNSSEEPVVSCSATARPAPTVTLRVLQQDLHFSNYSSVSVTNTNGTVTVTTTTVLSSFRGNNTQVVCAARVLSGPQIEVFMMIPEVKQSSADGFGVESGSKDRDHITDFIWIIVLLVVASGCGVAAHLLIRKHKHGSGQDKHQLNPLKNTPGHRSKEDGARHNRLININIEGLEPPQEVKPAQALIVDGLRICGPVQFFVQCDTQVFIFYIHVQNTSFNKRFMCGSVKKVTLLLIFKPSQYIEFVYRKVTEILVLYVMKCCMWTANVFVF
ncbi:uncharacterized protein LOC127378388 isoform X12 [Dicentrarchus labrax]|uniref:uncharacterized protein LOC127378388 isoform X12 n=1 Tax=Dicentrarchus labrax TaxID=13489 RepID=UPI0021F51B50|nr:uncharacterized protein LOC127378388 isoform X12 [Dicentrarchus labrax]